MKGKAAVGGIIREGEAGMREWDGRWTGEAGRRSRWVMGHHTCPVQEDMSSLQELEWCAASLITTNITTDTLLSPLSRP